MWRVTLLSLRTLPYFTGAAIWWVLTPFAWMGWLLAAFAVVVIGPVWWDAVRDVRWTLSPTPGRMPRRVPAGRHEMIQPEPEDPSVWGLPLYVRE